MIACFRRAPTRLTVRFSKLIEGRFSECQINNASRMLVRVGTTRLSSSSSSGSGIFTDEDDEEEEEGGRAPLALIFDTETNGKLDFKKEGEMDTSSQPALVQLGMILVDTATWIPKLRTCMLIQEVSFMEEGAQKIHGIAVQDCQRYGVPQVLACQQFRHLVTLADCLVAHNLNFDERVMKIAMQRVGLPPIDPLRLGENRQSICTMKESTDIVGIPATFVGKSAQEYKWPTLAEAYQHFTSRTLENGGHDAMVDAEACLTIFQSLVESGKVQLRKRASDKDQRMALDILKRAKTANADSFNASNNNNLGAYEVPKPGELLIHLDPTTNGNENNGFRITGNTYKYRQQMRALGGEWDPAARAWVFRDPSLLSAAQRLVGGMPQSPNATATKGAQASVGTRGDPWKDIFE